MMLMLIMSSWWMYVVYVHGGCSDLLDIPGEGRGSLRILTIHGHCIVGAYVSYFIIAWK